MMVGGRMFYFRNATAIRKLLDVLVKEINVRR
jgi:hypothetical protein